jgi:nucleotide-binding universal stress UspA family protein
VIGNHGYHGVDRILGTTAGRIIHRAKRDVLIVYRGGRE